MEDQILAKMDRCDKFVLSYGGGINSSALFFWLQEHGWPLDLVIFADTGEEREETYDAVGRMKVICFARGIDFQIVQSPYGNLYTYYWKKKVIMSKQKRDCTGKFKVAPIRNYLRENFPQGSTFGMYIGIASDEDHRAKPSDVQYIENFHPFVYEGVGREGNKTILRENNFHAEKSGCKGCMQQSKKQWVKMLVHEPKEFERHLALELNCSRYPQLTLSGSYTLQSLKDKFSGMSPLSSFDHIDGEEEGSCISANGGCFL